MSKGLKIYRAKHRLSGHSIYLDSFNEDDRENLECEICNARLKYTKGHWRNNNRTWVSSFFSLSPNSFHSDSCNYNVRKAIKILVRDSVSIEGSKQATLFKNAISFEFRLHVLADSISNESKNLKDSNDQNKSVNRVKSSEQLAAYLKTAKGIVKLWNAIQTREDKELLKENIQLVMRNKRVSWNDFVFETSDLEKVVSKSPKYPVALILQTKKLNKPNRKRPLQNCIQCYAGTSNDEKSIIPRIYFNGNLFNENKQYLVVGYIKASEIKKDSSFINLNIFINNKSQVTLLNNEEINTPNTIYSK